MVLASKIERPDNEFYASPIGAPVIISVILHVAVFIFATVGIPYIAKDIEPFEETIMTVDLVNLSDISQSNNIDEPKESEDDMPAPPSKPKPVYNQSESVPDLLTPREPEPLVEEESISDPTLIEVAPEPKVKPKLKIKPKPVIESKTEVDDKVEPQEDFTSLLKSLTPDEPQQVQSTQDDAQDLGQTSQVADYSSQLTMSEMDRLNRGVSPCWNVNAGGKDAGSLSVRLRVTVNPDMRVGFVDILDQVQYATNSHYSAAADAARRALLNERCRKLNLPVEKYEQWKVFTYIFDPSEMI